MKISIIIPTLNEADNITATLAATQATNVEVIVVDGGSEDDTVAIAQTWGVKVIFSDRGRATQMNAGAKTASGDILLFLHADTRLPRQFDVMVRKVLKKPGVAGAFDLRIDAPDLGLRLVEWGVFGRSHWFQMPYGDQAIFLTKDLFEKMGGFPKLPIMEDFEFVRHLRSLGKIHMISVPVITSARRWKTKGILQTTLMNQVIVIAYYCGVSPVRLRQWYRSRIRRR